MPRCVQNRRHVRADPALKLTLGAGRRLRAITVTVALVGIITTIVLTALARLVDIGSDQRLLRLQVRQSASALAAALPSIQTELLDGLQVAQATGSPARFEQFMGAKLGTGGFASVSLWKRSGTALSVQASVGASPALVADGRARSFLAGLAPNPRLQVTDILPDRPADRIGFAEMPPGDRDLIVYAEKSLPAGRHLRVPRRSAFSDLNFAVYLGATTPSRLLEASVPTPIHGLKSSSTVPFGNTALTLVGTPTTDLAGGLSDALPWIVLGLGLPLSAVGAVLAEYVMRRRNRAEDLAGENERLYLEQRRIATDLQQALLPVLPEVPGLDIGARYIAGTAGLDVGGDWYDVIPRDGGACTFVVGDVCGRGLKAATTMAALRFATRAYAAEGADPAALLRKLSGLQIFDDDTFATVLVGAVDVTGRSLTLASAGHPPPLLLTDSQGCFVPVPSGVPVGVGQATAEAVTVEIPPGSILVAYTDGLVERRDQAIDEGMERLRTVNVVADSPVEALLDRLVTGLAPSAAPDDTALLALRWKG